MGFVFAIYVDTDQGSNFVLVESSCYSFEVIFESKIILCRLCNLKKKLSALHRSRCSIYS